MRDESARKASPAMSRRTVMLGMLGLPFVVSACTGAGEEPGSDAGAFPVDIAHRFGTTTVRKQPLRIATFGFAAADVCLALGIAPVGMPGSNATPWYNLRRIAEETLMPVLYADELDLSLAAIEELEPDLIFTLGADITRAQYDQLSEIAPVVHGTTAGKPTWRETVDVVARAIGRADEGADLVRDTERTIPASVSDYPDLAGVTVLVVEAFPVAGADLAVYGEASGPANLLGEFGLRPAPLPTGIENAGEVEDDVFGRVGQLRWPRAQAEELRAEVLVLVAERQRSQELADELGPDLDEATQVVIAPKDEMGAAMIMESPLSIEWLARNFIPVLAEAAFNAQQ
ncbi:ABC transporter substrate-binding protein [Arthrobacter agilis]|nr:ABC transporter substrate-binding protein [Arthrobacter agilis]